LYAVPRLRVVRTRDERLLAYPHLQREGALAGFRQELLGIEAKPDLGVEAEAVETACRKHDRIQPALVAFPQTRVDVAAKRLDGKLRLEREQLGAPSSRGRADAHPRPKPARTAERVARVLAREIRADNETVGVLRRHVLRRVDG